MKIYPYGSPESPIWVVTEYPLPNDDEKGYLFSSKLGWHFHKMWQEAGLPPPYITCLKPDPYSKYNEDTVLQEFLVNNCLSSFDKDNEQIVPPLIMPLGSEATIKFLPSTQKKIKSKKGEIKSEASLDKWVGSMLISPFIDYEHYCIPGYTPDYILYEWAYRDIFINIDLGHLRYEYEYWMIHKKLQPLPSRSLITEPKYDELMDFLEKVLHYKDRQYPYASNDIETIRPSKNSPIFRGHPGYPYTNSFAISPTDAISFCLWDYKDSELCNIWTICDAIYHEVPIIGQNYFNFDAHLLRAIGFRINMSQVYDTMIRHHELWVELPHSLKFQTKQYTRQPFYKDDGKTWSIKQKKPLMYYNCLDTAVDFEVFLGQEGEFNEKPYLS